MVTLSHHYYELINPSLPTLLKTELREIQNCAISEQLNIYHLKQSNYWKQRKSVRDNAKKFSNIFSYKYSLVKPLSLYWCAAVSSSFEYQIIVICFRWLRYHFLNWHTVCDLADNGNSKFQLYLFSLDFFSHPSLIPPGDFQRLTNRARTTELIFSVFLV